MALSPRPRLKLVAGFALLAFVPTVQAQLVSGFIENRGQWPDEVLYMARLSEQTVWVTREGIVYDFFEVEPTNVVSLAGTPPRRGIERPADAEGHARGHVVALRFEGRSAGTVRPGMTLPTRLNYFLGNDAKRHARNVSVVEDVLLEGLYDGVALRLQPAEGMLNLTFETADPQRLAQIRLTTSSGEVMVAPDGEVVVATSLGTRRIGVVLGSVGNGETKQLYAGTTVAAGMQVDRGRVASASRAGSPAPAHSADGGLDFSTFLGGNHSESATAVAVGSDGSTTVAGSVISSDFPATVGAYDDSLNVDAVVRDAFVARLSADGTSLLYATFLGGANIDDAYDVALGVDGSATVAGLTRSSDFPTLSEAYDETYNGGVQDAFVARLSADGSSLLYSTFLGGADHDYGYAVALGADGAATVAGQTWSSDFPTTIGSYDEAHNGDADAFVTRLSADGKSLLYSTFLGGAWGDGSNAVAVDADGSATVAGHSFASPFDPLVFPTTPGAYDETIDGRHDVFVARLSADGTSLLYSTFLGGAQTDLASDIAVYPDGSAVVVGTSESLDFPTTSGAYDETHLGAGRAFVTRLSADGKSLLFSTFLGGTYYQDYVNAVTLGADDSIILAGLAKSPDFPTTNGAFDETFNYGHISNYYDGFVAQLSADGTSLLYSTFLGGTEGDGATDIVAGANNLVSVVGSTASADFPTTPDAYDETHNGGGDAFVARFQFPGTTPIDNPPAGLRVSALHGAAPNPFHRIARLGLEIAEVQGVTVRVYDIAGREVARLLDAHLAPGVYEVIFDAARLPSGVYFVRAVGEWFTHTQHVTLIR